MIKSIAAVTALLTCVLLPMPHACAQAASSASSKDASANHRAELALTYTHKLSKIANLDNSVFGMNGASLDAVYWMGNRTRPLGLALDVSGETASAITPGVDLNQFTVVAGPRATLWQWRTGRAHPSLYGETLLGVVHGFSSVFPGGATNSSSATAFALQSGGGINLPLRKGWGLRLVAIDYHLTALPNNTDTYQGSLRISSGITHSW